MRSRQIRRACAFCFRFLDRFRHLNRDLILQIRVLLIVRIRSRIFKTSRGAYTCVLLRAWQPTASSFDRQVIIKCV